MDVDYDLMSQEYTAREEGYIFVYLSNENPTLVDVFFDDVTITRTNGNIIQSNEYYPYGLQTANSWTRENNTGNNFLYNGGTELNAATQVYDLHYRNYGPVLGRFGQVDPMASSFAGISPYNYGNNDPVYYNDPLGDCPSCPNFEDRYDVRNGPHDTGNGFRVSKDGDPYGNSRSRWLYADKLERMTYQDPTVEIYNKWCGCYVSATEILSETNPNQNKELRGRAAAALSLSKTKTSNSKKEQTSPAMNAAIAASAFLAFDNVTVVLTADDILIPFLFGAAYLADLYSIHSRGGNEGYLGPWIETVGDKTDEFYKIESKYNYEDDPLKNIDPKKVGVAAGSVTTLLILLHDKMQRQEYNKSITKDVKSKSDATKYVIPKRPN